MKREYKGYILESNFKDSRLEITYKDHKGRQLGGKSIGNINSNYIESIVDRVITEIDMVESNCVENTLRRLGFKDD